MNAISDPPELDIDPYASENLLDPYPMHEQVRAAGPVVKLKPYGVFACARYAEVHAVLNNWQTFISSAGVGLANFNTETPFRPKSLILEADPPLHTQTRTVLSRILSPKAVTQIRATFTAEAEALIDHCVAKGKIDGIQDLAQVYPLKVFPDAVGLEPDGRENLLIYGDMIFNAMGPRNELLTKSAARVGPVTQWIMDHCERRMLRPGGFGDQIYQAADAGEITYEQAPLLVRSFLSAGVDTTINGIGNALFSLAHHPEQYTKLHADPSLARPAFEEALRYESTAQTFFRTAGRDCDIAGAPVPHDMKVLLFLAAANRDPRKWPEPERYDIERRPTGHVAMGSGIHGCVGQAVARLEGEVVLTALAKRVKHIEVNGPHTRRLNNTLRAGYLTAALHSCITRSSHGTLGMPKLTLVQPDGSTRTLDAREGNTVMHTATGADVHGIVAECGGSAMCATCHVYVDSAWVDKLPVPLANELEMLDCTAAERRPESRLSCQIRLSAALDGLIVRVPEKQQ